MASASSGGFVSVASLLLRRRRCVLLLGLLAAAAVFLVTTHWWPAHRHAYSWVADQAAREKKAVKQLQTQRLKSLAVASNERWQSVAVNDFLALDADDACDEDVVTVVAIRTVQDIEHIKKAKSCHHSSALILLSPEVPFQSVYNNVTPNFVIASSAFPKDFFRPGLDVALPDLSVFAEKTAPPPIFPLRRKIELAYFSDDKVDGVSDLSVAVGSRGGLLKSTFVLLSVSDSLVTRLWMALSAGAVPVIVSDAPVGGRLPFGDVIDWTQAVVTLSKAAAKHLASSNSAHFLGDSELFYMRRQGRRIFNAYLNSIDRVLDTITALVRHRRGIEPPWHANILAVDAFTGVSLSSASSDSWRRSFSSPREAHFRWNVAFFPWRRSPVEADFVAATAKSASFSQLVRGEGVSEERFTVVVMTFKRIDILAGLFFMLSNLRYLDSVVLIWNDVNSSAPQALSDLLVDFPTLKVKVIKAKENSLNNRMLPYEVIDTMAVMQIDDDTRNLTPESVSHAFSMWQRNRQALVGFMGRDAKPPSVWTDQWQYVARMLCTQSMVLTTAVFHHKYYLYRYTFEFSPSLVSLVDELMNCEDIFLNAMAQDLTDSAAIMASEWSERSSGHYEKRSSCLDAVVSSLGYLPLIPSGHYAGSLKRDKCDGDLIFQ